MKCSREGCQNEISEIKGVVQFYCSKRCRLLGRGSKRAKRIVRRMDSERR